MSAPRGRRALGLLLLAPLLACEAAAVRESPFVDHDLGRSWQGMTVGEAGGCSTAIVHDLTVQLVEELNCIQPGVMVDFSGPDTPCDPAVQPYLQPGAAAALHAATADRGDTLFLSSAYRSVAQQYLLYRWWQQGGCGIQIAAGPGRSNHQSGLAVDVPAYELWRAALGDHGFQWYGPGDAVHFDFGGEGTVDLRTHSVTAFQRLWNKNMPGKLDEDGVWTAATELAMSQAPAEGFPFHGCGPVLPPGECVPPGQGASQPALFAAAWARNGGEPAVGCGLADARAWGQTGVETQDFGEEAGRTGALFHDAAGAAASAHYLGGAVFSHYLGRSGPAGPLGGPLSDELDADPSPAGTTGSWTRFEQGAITSAPGLGTHAVFGESARVWSELGGTAGCGFVTADAQQSPPSGSGTTGRSTLTEGCQIEESRHGAFAIAAPVLGVFRDWLEGTGGALGFPLGPIEPDGERVRQRFEGGCVVWFEEAGAYGIVPECAQPPQG